MRWYLTSWLADTTSPKNARPTHSKQGYAR